MAASDNSATIAAVANRVRTVGQARVVLGNVATVLQSAYGKLEGAHFADESNDARRDDLAQATRARLDGINRYATKVYASLSAADEDQGLPVGAHAAAQVGLVLAQAQEACKDIETVLGENQWDLAGAFLEGVKFAAETAGKAADKAAKGALAALCAFIRSAWLSLTIVGLVIALWLLWPRIARRIAK